MPHKPDLPEILPLTYNDLHKPVEHSTWEWLRVAILVLIGSAAIGYDQWRDAAWDAEHKANCDLHGC